MGEMRFTEDHEWVLPEEDGTALVGITDYAQDQLGELVFVELPEIGTEFSQHSDAVVIESVKAAGEVKAPVSGTVLEVNESLVDEPDKVNVDPTGDGWFIKLRMANASELGGLMSEDDYQAYVATL